MRTWIAFPAALAFAGLLMLTDAAGAQVSMAEHIALAKRGNVGAREAAFAARCGVARSTASVVYGHSLDEAFTFAPIPAVGDSTEAQIDNYGTAEVWYVDGKPRLANVWYAIMDVGSYANELICLDTGGKVTARETLNTNEPPGDAKDYWRHDELMTFAADGRPTIVSNRFVSRTGAPIAVAPKLDKDSMFQATTQTPTETLMKVVQLLPMKAK